MNDLPLEKQLLHRCFCDAIKNIEDLEELKNQVGKLHLLYLRQQVMFTQLAKDSIA